MWVETKHRIIAILKTLTAIDGTHYTVPDSTPPSRSDHHGYVIWVRPTRDTVQVPLTSDQRTHTLNFAIDCISSQALTGLPVVNEWKIEAYADAITALLERYPRLESLPTDDSPGRVGLTGVSSTFVNGVQFQSPRSYPDANQQQQFYSCTISLQVTFDRATGC